MVEYYSTRFMIWAILMVSAGAILLCGSGTVSGQCQGDIQGLMQQCSRYVQKSGPNMQPSQGCCGVLKNVDLACVCQHVTDQVEQIISLEKAAYVARMCGKPLAPGTKCGSYTVPRS